MELPQDLKNYRAEDSFQIVPPATAAKILAWALLTALFLEGALAPKAIQPLSCGPKTTIVAAK